MKKLPLLIVAILACGASAEALPYMPDTVEWSVLTTRFKETGTDTACIHCDDADPTNDLILTVMFGGGIASGNGFGRTGGWLGIQGNLLPSIYDVNLTIQAFLRVQTSIVAQDPSEYPKPSVAYGWLDGWLLGREEGSIALIEDCCGGVIGNHAMFKSPQGPSIWERSTLGQWHDGNGGIPLNGEVQWGPLAAYTPAVETIPEPATLLLLGTGLVGFIRRRRR